MLFIGIDGGGTNTAGVACNEEGEILAFSLADSTNYHNVGLENAFKILEKLVISLLSQSGFHEADGVFYGLAGIDSKKDKEMMRSVLKRIPRVKEFTLGNDTENVYYSTTFGKPGIVVISGTGSNVFGRNAKGEEWRAGDHGHALGDQGSAYYIAIEALRAAMKSYDGRGEKTELERLFCSLYGVDNLGELPSVFYSLKQDVSEIASLAKHVDTLAQTGDAVSKRILENAAEELVCGVKAVARALRLNEERSFIVGGAGGVLLGSKIVWENFKKRVVEEFPYAFIKGVLPSWACSLGGVVYYLQKTGFEITDSKFEKMKKALYEVVNEKNVLL